MKKMIAVIPSYQPDGHLITLAEELRSSGFSVLIVNDGSDLSYDEIFEKAAENACVIKLEKNSGKGAALKAGIAYVEKEFPDAAGFVTIDGDGQHKPSDAVRIAEMIENGSDFVLSERAFYYEMPFKSKFGNSLSKFVFEVMTGLYMKDNQSGLRGFSKEQTEWLKKVNGTGYDYEMNVIYHALELGVRWDTLGIEATYIDGNSSSHFRPMQDTMSIYRTLFASGMADFISFFLEEMLIAIMTVTKFSALWWLPLMALASGIFRDLLNRTVFFRNFALPVNRKALIRKIIRISLAAAAAVVFRRFTGLFLIYNAVIIIYTAVEYFITKNFPQ